MPFNSFEMIFGQEFLINHKLLGLYKLLRIELVWLKSRILIAKIAYIFLYYFQKLDQQEDKALPHVIETDASFCLKNRSIFFSE